LCLDRVLTDVKVSAKLAIGHSCRKQGQEFAFAFGESDVAARPAHSLVDLGVLGPLRQLDSFAARGSPDATNDLFSGHGLRDESSSAGTKGLAHHLRPIGKAEHHDGSVFRVGAKCAHTVVEREGLSIGIEQRDVDRSPGRLPDVELDDPDLRIAVLEEGTQALENDHIIVDEGHPN